MFDESPLKIGLGLRVMSSKIKTRVKLLKQLGSVVGQLRSLLWRNFFHFGHELAHFFLVQFGHPVLAGLGEFGEGAAFGDGEGGECQEKNQLQEVHFDLM